MEQKTNIGFETENDLSTLTKEELGRKRKENLTKLPNYRGEVVSKNTIRQLPNVQPGDLFWVEMDNMPVVVEKKTKKVVTLKALDENASVSTGLTLYDFNHMAVSKEPLLDWNNKEVIDNINKDVTEWIADTTKDTEFYMLYGREIHYFTMLKKTGQTNPKDFLTLLKEILEEFSQVISIDVDNLGEQKRLEIWVRTIKNKAELLYLFPYDEGIVEF